MAFAVSFLALIIFGLLLRERANVLTFFFQVGWVTLTLNVVAMILGYAIAKLAKLDAKKLPPRLPAKWAFKMELWRLPLPAHLRY